MRVILLAALCFFMMNCCTGTSSTQDLTLRYNKPATIWEETLPLGNGRIGMMPDGGIEKEHIVLNDITMWSRSLKVFTRNSTTLVRR